MNINKVIAFLIFGLITIKGSVAQEENGAPKKVQECLISISDFQPLRPSLGYKRQIKNLTFFKISLIDLNYSHSDHSSLNLTGSTNENINGGILVGLEFRRPLNKVFTLYHGPGIGFSCFYSKQVSVISNMVSPKVVYSVGILAKLTDHFYLAADIDPSISYSFTKVQNYSNTKNSYTDNSLAINFGNKNATLSLVYKLN